MSEKLKVGILGATGMVGQRFISLLENHPWFEVVTVAASPRSAGKTYEEAVGGRWKMDTPMPEAVKKLVVMDIHEVEKVAATVDFVFSAVDMTKDEIKAIEEEYAKTETPVVSNNSAHRWTPDVPMVVPEINPEYFKVIEFQKKASGNQERLRSGKPNCSNPELCTGSDCMERNFEPYEVVANDVSGNLRSWQDVQRLAGDGKVTSSRTLVVRRRKSEQEPLRLWGEIEGRRDREGIRAGDYLPVHPCTGSGRTYSSRICKVQKETNQRAADREAG